MCAHAKTTWSFHFFGKTIVGVSMFLSFVFLPANFSSALVSVPSVEDRLSNQFCLDEEGVTKGIIDLVLLMDNSTSLGQAKTPTDPNETRFRAIVSLFEAVGGAIEGTDTKVNFGLIKFAARAEEVRGLELGKEIITLKTSKNLAQKVRDSLPIDKQENGTNYINALDKALEVVENKSDKKNCRILIWFTDGMFSSGASEEDSKRLLGKLSGLACDKGGFVDKVRELDIFPFVLLLQPSSSSTDEAVRKSYELMEQITGSTMPSLFGLVRPSIECGEKETKIGEIFGVNEVSKLTPYFEDLGFRVGGGKLFDLCPMAIAGLTEYTSQPLPASHFLRWISIVSLKGEPLPSYSDIFSVTSDREQPISDAFDVSKKSSTSFTLSPNDGAQLTMSWKLRIKGDIDGFCIRGAFIEPLTVKLSRNGSADAVATQIDGDEVRLTDKELTEISYQVKKKPSTITNVFVEGQKGEADISASLDVDPSKKLAPNGLVININRSFVGSVDIDCRGAARFVVPKTSESGSGDMPKPAIVHSDVCVLDASGVNNKITISSAELVTKLSETEDCKNLVPALVVDGKTFATHSIDLGGNALHQVSLQLKVDGKESRCNFNSDSAVSISWNSAEGQTQSVPLPVSINLDLSVPPIWWIPYLITLIAVVLAAVFSLLLLRLVSMVLAVMPDEGKFYGFEFDALIGIGVVGEISVTISGSDSAKFEPQIAGLRPPKRKGRDSIAVHTVVLERRLPGILNPFREPKAIVPKQDGVVYRQSTPNGGLAIPFSKAMVIRPSIEKSANLEQIAATITLFMPKGGEYSGVQGIKNQIATQQFKEAAREFMDIHRGSMKKADPGMSGTSGGEIQRKAPPPPPVRPRP